MHCTIHELSLNDSPRTDGVCLFPARRPTPLRVDRKRALPQRAGKCCPIGREDPFTGRTPERVTPCNPSSGGIGGMHDAEHFGRRNIERSDMIAQGTGPIPAAGVPSASPAPEGGCKRSDSGAKGGGDTASISHTAAALTHSGLLDDLFGFEPAVSGRYTLREIELHARRFLSKFNSDFRSLLREKGVGLDTPIELGHASDGSVMVTNDHSHRNAIEAIFAERPELRNEYTKITSMLTLVEHARKAGAFHQAYREDPRAAAARYASLFTSSASVGIRISEHGTDIVLHRRTRRSG